MSVLKGNICVLLLITFGSLAGCNQNIFDANGNNNSLDYVDANSENSYASWDETANDEANENPNQANVMQVAAAAAPASTNVSAIQVSFAKGTCLGINAGVKTPGIPVQLASCNKESNQSFVFSRTANGLYVINNAASGLCLEQNSKNPAAGNEVLQRPCIANLVTQQWLVAGNSLQNFYIRTKDGKAGLSLAASQSTKQAPPNGFKLITLASTGTPQQSFTLPGFRVKSIRSYAKCDGVTDDRDAVNKAVFEARNFAFTLLVDCPVRIKIGSSVHRPIFLYSGTTLSFNSQGKFIIDNATIPGFVMANISNISILNASIEYVGSVPYEKSKVMAAQFNDITLRNWLAANPKVIWKYWNGPTDLSSVFYVQGPTANIAVRNMRAYVPNNVGGERLIPGLFNFAYGGVNNSTIEGSTPKTTKYFGIVKNVEFENITLDGTYMGITGHVQNATFNHIRSYRYGDVQDPKGGNIGGTLTSAGGPWFSPPHLFYLNYDTSGDPDLFTRNVRINDVIDYGVRVTKVPRIEGGYNNSIKISGDDVIVDGYQSFRPDGFVQINVSNNLTIRNVSGTFDSNYTKNRYPIGLMFSGGVGTRVTSYSNIRIYNINMKDLAATPTRAPVSPSKLAGNHDIQIYNTHFDMNKWGTDLTPLTTVLDPINFYGTKVSGTITYTIVNSNGNTIQLKEAR